MRTCSVAHMQYCMRTSVECCMRMYAVNEVAVLYVHMQHSTHVMYAVNVVAPRCDPTRLVGTILTLAFPSLPFT